MKEKTKKFLQKYLIGFILGFVSVGIVAVYAETYFPSNDVTYDNTKSGLSSTDVQGAIDELYGVCFPPKTGGDAILDDTDIVTSGDGLYEDEYEDGRYFYKGGNPNNYITFNNEKAGWRIMSIEADGSIKIIKNGSIGAYAWDSNGSRDWTKPSSLNLYLNYSYLSSLSHSDYILTHKWSIGTVEYSDEYLNNLAKQIDAENAKTFNGKIGLMTASEYIRANLNTERCGTIKLNNNNAKTCLQTNWMYFSKDYWWTITTIAIYITNVGGGGYDGLIGDNFYNSDNQLAVAPALYLSPEVQITGGNGSINNPYTIA